jgi:hypothetical protein
MMKKFLATLMVAALALSANTAMASLTMDSDVGTWTGTDAGVNVQTQTVTVAYGNTQENQIRWGVPYPGSVPNTIDNQSGLGFTGKAPSGAPVTFELGDAFEIGQLSHFNHEIANDGSPTEAYLQLVMAFTTPDGPLSQTFNFTFGVDETPGLNVDDIITFPNAYAAENVVIGENTYTVQLLGFGDSPDNLVDQFISVENGQVNSTLLWGRITERPAIPVPGAILLSSIGLGLVGYLRRRNTL